MPTSHQKHLADYLVKGSIVNGPISILMITIEVQYSLKGKRVPQTAGGYPPTAGQNVACRNLYQQALDLTPYIAVGPMVKGEEFAIKYK